MSKKKEWQTANEQDGRAPALSLRQAARARMQQWGISPLQNHGS